MVLVGAGVLLIVALFLVNIVSRQEPPAATETAPSAGVAEGAVVAEVPDPEEVLAGVETEPLPPQLAARAAELEDEIAGLDETAGAARRVELANLYASAGQFGPAAIEQRKAAEQQGTFDAWRRAGNLFYDWMDTVEGPAKRDVAQLTVDAYQRALTINPEDLDVRTDMATAYLNTTSPMRAVQEIQQVLAEDPDHIQANFNYGYMLLMINRVDQAEAQFEKVQEIAGPNSPYYDRAAELLELFELTAWKDTLVESYSHGMRQKLLISSALIHGPRLIVVDEPMVGLDPKAARMIKELLRAFVDQGGTVFLSTHTLEVAEALTALAEQQLDDALETLSEQTSDETLAFAESFVADVDKTAVTVTDSPGFATSRLGVAVGVEAVRMVQEGVASPRDIDAAMELGYNHPMGPLELGDVVGLDVRLDILEHLREELGERFRPPHLLRRKVRAGKLGKKAGEGFYVWEDGEIVV